MRTKQLVLLLALVAGCSGVGGSTETYEGDEPDRVTPDYWLPGEDREAVEAETQRDLIALREKGPGTIVRLFEDDIYDVPPEPEQPGDVEKGTFAALLGWGINGSLVFQDGVPSAVDGTIDHCSRFGLRCDNAWHIQATDVNINSNNDWIDADSFRSRCGSYVTRADGTNNRWFPCVLPNLTPTNRIRKWWFDAASCPNETTRRGHMRAAISSLNGWIEQTSDITWTEAASSADAHLVFKCTSGLPTVTAMRFRPQGPLTLRYATALAGAPADFTESCETPGQPGSNPVATYKQSPDMMYTYSAAVIDMNWEPTFQFVAGCATTSSLIRRSLGNIVAHEVGHYFTLAHNQINNGATDVMRAGQSCTETIANSKGYTSFENSAIFTLDTSTLTPALTVPDVDLSCVKPENQ